MIRRDNPVWGGLWGGERRRRRMRLEADERPKPDDPDRGEDENSDQKLAGREERGARAATVAREAASNPGNLECPARAGGRFAAISRHTG
ncbi:MAG: hypothetical protein HY777_11510 [Betaproteobacteria bacterium]|nr:hypothetical protein [Betaproteobacteria bacterium]